MYILMLAVANKAARMKYTDATTKSDTYNATSAISPFLKY